MEKRIIVRKPKIALVGTFNDWFLEGVTELDMDFTLCSNENGVSKKRYDIVVIAPDRTDNAYEAVIKFGAVPVVSAKTDGFKSFDPIKETGNAFLYYEDNPWHMLEAIIKAQETYKFEYDWKTVVREMKDLLEDVMAGA